MKYRFKKFIPLFLFSIGFFSSCASKKNIILFGDIQESTKNNVLYALPKIQVNDILDLKISTLNPETALPYNSVLSLNAVNSIELLKLQGHLVSAEGKIILPVLGAIVAKEKTTASLEKEIVSILEASYGITGVTVTVDPTNIVIGRKVSNKMAGSDPAPKQKKVMTILAVVKGEQVEKEFTEGEVISF